MIVLCITHYALRITFPALIAHRSSLIARSWSLGDALRLRLAVEVGVKVQAALIGGLVLLHGNAVLLGIRIVPDTGHLPRHFAARRAARAT